MNFELQNGSRNHPKTCDCIETGSADLWMQLATVKPWKFQRDSEGPCQNTPDSYRRRTRRQFGSFWLHFMIILISFRVYFQYIFAPWPLLGGLPHIALILVFFLTPLGPPELFLIHFGFILASF